MKQSDLSLLQLLAIEPVVEWEKKVPAAALRRLSALEFVEVETRRCTTWKFGDDNVRTFTEWRALQNTRTFHDRTIVVARITQAGLDFLRAEE